MNNSSCLASYPNATLNHLPTPVLNRIATRGEQVRCTRAHTLEESGPGRQALLTNREDHADCGLLCGCAAAEPAAEHVLRLRDLGVSRHSHR